jgi:putative oxidoreductase
MLSPGALRILRLVMTCVFVGGGILKLAGSAPMVQLFADIGVGQWLRYLVGSMELLGGATLLVPRWGGVAALCLIVMMIGATMAQLLIIRRPPLAAAACTVALMAIVWSSRDEALTPFRRRRGE